MTLITLVQVLIHTGNASSLPPRLPFLSPVMRILRDQSPKQFPLRYKMVCCSYRGYWTSKGRASEKGITRDAQATLNWVKRDSLSSQAVHDVEPCQFVIWGQSIGAGVAARLVADTSVDQGLAIHTLILETPFLSIRDMLETLYPQKWLPYRYLWPFLRNHLDTMDALGKFRSNKERLTRVLILQAGKDELVPSSHPEELEHRCTELGIEVRRKVISGALHTEVLARPEGRLAVAEAISKVATRPG